MGLFFRKSFQLHIYVLSRMLSLRISLQKSMVRKLKKPHKLWF